MSRLSRRTFLALAAGVSAAPVAQVEGQSDPMSVLRRTRPQSGPTAAGRHARGQAAGSVPAVTLACANYIRFMPIATGDVKRQGAALTWLRGDRAEMLRRATSDPAVDGGESSMAQHVMRLDRGDRSLVAIPIFPLRNFTARDLYTRKGSSLTPKMLAGRRVGIYNWAASGAVWYRHLMRTLGHDIGGIKWVVGSPDTPAPLNPGVTLPAHVTLAPQGKSLSDLLLAGDIEAFFAPLPPRQYHRLDGPIVRLMGDYRAIEQRYFKDTGCYPPQHVVLVRRAVWERHPSIGRILVDTFNRSEAAFHADQRLYPYNSPWLIADVEDTELTMGAEYHAHGLEKNRRAVDVFCQGAFDDGLTKRRLSVEEFFAEFVAT